MIFIKMVSKSNDINRFDYFFKRQKETIGIKVKNKQINGLLKTYTVKIYNEWEILIYF